ncbi:MAG TPA: DUF6152 family protein [Steroidobacteraceae bacterium]
MTGRYSLALLLMVLAWPVFAHHNAASHYQLDKSITVEGVVTSFRMVNPHVLVYLDAKSPSGDIQHWIAEGNSVGVLERVGWKADSLKSGEKVKIVGRPSRDGSNLVLWTTITKENGTILYGGVAVSAFGEEGVSPEEHQRLEDLRKRQIEERSQSGQQPPPGSPPQK